MVHCPVFEGRNVHHYRRGFCVFLVLWKCFEPFNGCGWEARTFTNDLGVSKNRGVSPQIIHFNRVFHYFHHPFWGFYPYFWVDTHLKPYIFWQMATRDSILKGPTHLWPRSCLSNPSKLKLNRTESQGTPYQVSCEDERLYRYSGVPVGVRWNVGPVGPISSKKSRFPAALEASPVPRWFYRFVFKIHIISILTRKLTNITWTLMVGRGCFLFFSFKMVPFQRTFVHFFFGGVHGGWATHL